MQWLKKNPQSKRVSHGLEWAVWRKLPVILLVGTALPLLLSYVIQWWAQDGETPPSWALMADYITLGVLFVHWSIVLTVAIGCVIVWMMKGPCYEADSYPLSHRDQPRLQHESLDPPDSGDPGS